MSSNTVEVVITDEGWEDEVLQAIRGLRYGSVEVTLHAGRVVQIERRERVRLDEAGRRRADGLPCTNREPNGNEGRASGSRHARGSESPSHRPPDLRRRTNSDNAGAHWTTGGTEADMEEKE